MNEIFETVMYYFSNFIVFYFIALNSIYFLLLILSTPQVLKRARQAELEEKDLFFYSKPFPPVTIIAPAYNEAPIIEASINQMMQIHYPKFEVIVVNDGSTDNTLEILTEAFDLYMVPTAFQIKIPSADLKAVYRSAKYKNLIIIDKVNGGKADSLNSGINAAQFAYFLALDADTLIANDALYRSMVPMITEKNVVAVGGTVGVINNSEFEEGKVTKVRFPTNFYAAIQVVEYIRAYLFGRVGWNWLGGNMVISGAFGLFDKQKVIELGGYLTDTVGEDLELTLKLHHGQRKEGKRYKIVSIPDTVCWTEVPEDRKVLSKQRERWHRGLIDSLWRHKEICLNPRYGILGLFTFPFFVLGELFAPVIEVMGWFCFPIGLHLGIVDMEYFALFVMASMGLSLLLTFASLILAQFTMGRYHSNKDFFKMFLLTIIENFGYRQMTVIWRMRSFYKYAVGNKSWGEMKRIGIKEKQKEKNDGKKKRKGCLKRKHKLFIFFFYANFLIPLSFAEPSHLDITHPKKKSKILLKQLSRQKKKALSWLKSQLTPNSVVETKMTRRENFVLSYNHPKDIKGYPYIFSRSNLYDNALAIIVFTMEEEYSLAEKVILALEKASPDGTLYFNYNTHNLWPNINDHEGALIRTGASAWLGYAISFYLNQMKLKNIEKPEINSFLLRIVKKHLTYLCPCDQKDPRHSLFLGGNNSYRLQKDQGGEIVEVFEKKPISWVSIEHNIDTYFFFKEALNLLKDKRLKKKIKETKNNLKEVLVNRAWNEELSQFNQGLRKEGPDSEEALDMASWGAIFLKSINHEKKATMALNKTNSYLSSQQSHGKGHLPYINKTIFESPEVSKVLLGEHQNWNDSNLLWFEGTFGVLMAKLKVFPIKNKALVISELNNLTYYQNSESGAFPYATINIPFSFSNSPSVASTAWFILCISALEREDNLNNFWN